MSDSFSKKVLRNFVIDWQRASASRNRRHPEELIDYYLELLGHGENYPSDSFVLYVDGHSSVVESRVLYKALLSMPKKQRNDLLLGGWYCLTDVEIPNIRQRWKAKKRGGCYLQSRRYRMG